VPFYFLGGFGEWRRHFGRALGSPIISPPRWSGTSQSSSSETPVRLVGGSASKAYFASEN
jgi:hypothetical protein